MLLRDTDPERWQIVSRLMDHMEDQKAKEENWKFYKEKVIDFLRITCDLKERFSEEEIFHVLGALDVNSVRIHADSSVPVNALCFYDNYIISNNTEIRHILIL